jgi:hypothetical protein
VKHEHTPGPWEACYSSDDEFGGGNIRSDHHRDGTGALLLEAGPMFHDYTPDREEERANLRLASAAPLLLKILEGFLATLDTDDLEEEAVVRSHYNTHIGLWNAAIDAHQAITREEGS